MGMFSNITLTPPDLNAGDNSRALLSDVFNYRRREKQQDQDFQMNLMALQEQQQRRALMERMGGVSKPMDVLPPNYSQINFDKQLDANLQMSKDRAGIQAEKNQIAERGMDIKEQLASNKDLTDSERIALQNSGRFDLENLRGSNSLARVNAQQTGANSRTAATIAGANQRNTDAIAGRATRGDASDAAAMARVIQQTSAAADRNKDIIAGQNYRSQANIAGMDRRAGVETPGGFSPNPPSPDVNLPSTTPSGLPSASVNYDPITGRMTSFAPGPTEAAPAGPTIMRSPDGKKYVTVPPNQYQLAIQQGYQKVR